MNTRQKTKIFLYGGIATASLLFFYFAVVTTVSGFPFAVSQFLNYWYFLVSLALGFGIQISLYVYLKLLVEHSAMVMGRPTVAVTGTTSTLAMISCCAHYLTNILPILGVTGVLSIIAEYQVRIFWVALLFNVFGVAFIANKIIKFKKIPMDKTVAISLLALLLIGFLIFFHAEPVSTPTEDGSSALSTQQKWEPKTDDQSAVSVTVTPLDISPESKEWKFTIAMSTHSVELKDPTKSIVLIGERGEEYRPIHWDGPTEGHHLSGVLTFDRITPTTGVIEMKISGIGDASRSFTWQLK